MQRSGSTHERHMGNGHSDESALTVTSACGMPNLGPPWSGWTTTTSPTTTCAGTGSPRLTSTTLPSTAIFASKADAVLPASAASSGGLRGPAAGAARDSGNCCKRNPARPVARAEGLRDAAGKPQASARMDSRSGSRRMRLVVARSRLEAGGAVGFNKIRDSESRRSPSSQRN